MQIRTWMSWEGGVDLGAVTRPDLPMPNVLIHVARMVHTPIGSAPSGMVLYQPDPAGQPIVIGFVSTDAKLAAWFGPNVFAGTPFEKAPALVGKISVATQGDLATSRVEVSGRVFETTMKKLAAPELIHRTAGSPMPFAQQGLEAVPGEVELKVDGKIVAITVPKLGIGGGPSALFSACGVYAR